MTPIQREPTRVLASRPASEAEFDDDLTTVVGDAEAQQSAEEAALRRLAL